MNPRQFLAEFHHLANAPKGVARLRDLVLALAVQGRLVAQDGTEEPAETQLARIGRIASTRAESGRRRRAAESTMPAGADLAESQPEGWARARMCDLVRVLNGRAYSKSELLEAGTPVLRVGNLFTSDHWYFSNLELEEDKYCDFGDLLYAWSASFGPFIWQGKRVIYHYHIWKLDLFSDVDIDKRFLHLWLLEKTQEIKAAGHGISMAHMTKDKFEQLIVDLPPLKEQSRIVEKVGDLMSLCDKLEQHQQDCGKMQYDLRRSTLQAVATASSPYELQITWARLESNFQSLFSASEDVGELRKLVLDLAIGGLLAQRNTADGSVAQFIDRCQKGKASRLASGQLKRKAAAATDVNQSEMVVPQHWEQLPLEELFQFIDYRGKTPAKTDSGVVLVTAKNVRPGKLNREPVEYISEKSYADWMTRGFPRAGDILFTTEAPLGNVALIEEVPKFALAQRIIDLQPFADLNTRCVMYFMMSPVFQALLERNSSGMTAKGIKAGKLKQLKLPVPPVEEQARIVERVDELMRLCEDLEGKLNRATKVAGRLAVAAVSALTGIAIEQQEDEPMKAPKTELIAPLRIGTPPDAKAQAPLASLLARHDGGMSARDLWQRFGGDVDAFYAQLKTEVFHGWIQEPAVAEMREKSPEAAGT